MGKTPKLKKKPVSTRSRAARRAASPSLGSNAAAAKASRADEHHRVDGTGLSRVKDAGILKKGRKARTMTTKKRRRNDLGKERAELTLEKLEKRVAGGEERHRVRKQRRGDWDELNEQYNPKRHAQSFEILADFTNRPRPQLKIGTENGPEDEWEEEEAFAGMDEIAGKLSLKPAFGASEADNVPLRKEDEPTPTSKIVSSKLVEQTATPLGKEKEEEEEEIL